MTTSYENVAFWLVDRLVDRFGDRFGNRFGDRFGDRLVARALVGRKFSDSVIHIRYRGSHVLDGLVLSFLP